jgi:hypothetical protein
MRDFVFPVGTRWRMGWYRGVAPIYSAASLQSRDDDAGFAGAHDFEREMTTLWPNDMGADITAFIQIDDNTPQDEAPFTNHPSTWDLSHDSGLAAGKHYEFYAAISGVRNQSGREPLYACRGLPPSGCETPKSLKELEGDFNVGWLTLSEIHAALQHMGVADKLAPSVLLLLRTMACAEEMFGKDRVRLVFQICD